MIPDLVPADPGPQAGGPDDHGDSAEGATALIVGEPARGALDHSGDIDSFVFEAVEGRSYRVEVALGSLEDSVVVLYDADGRELAFNDDHGDSLASLISWVAPESGRYYVEVGSFDASGTGSYTLSVRFGLPDDHADSAEGATVVIVDEPARGALDDLGDVDLFVFEAVEGRSYRVEVALGSLEGLRRVPVRRRRGGNWPSTMTTRTPWRR